MILNDYRNELKKLLFNACHADINFITKNLSNEQVTGYVIVCDSAFINFGAALCTEKYLITQAEMFATKIPKEWSDRNKAKVYIQMNVEEWGYFADNENFRELNQLAHTLANADCDGDLLGIYNNDDITDDETYINFYLDFICEVIESLKFEGFFKKPPFREDLLLGLQLFNPTLEQKKMMLQVSEKVNSPEWHKKMLEAYGK